MVICADVFVQYYWVSGYNEVGCSSSVEIFQQNNWFRQARDYFMDEAGQTLLSSADPGNNSAPVNSATFGLGPQEALEYRKRLRGMIGVASKVPLKDRSVLSLVYTQDIEEFIATGMALRPTFGGICLTGIAPPRCFTVADHLKRGLNFPVVHAEQDATAVAVLGGLLNALKLVGKAKEVVRVVINGAVPSGIGIARLLQSAGFQYILICDRLGILDRYRLENMH